MLQERIKSDLDTNQLLIIVNKEGGKWIKLGVEEQLIKLNEGGRIVFRQLSLITSPNFRRRIQSIPTTHKHKMKEGRTN